MSKTGEFDGKQAVPAKYKSKVYIGQETTKFSLESQQDNSQKKSCDTKRFVQYDCFCSLSTNYPQKFVDRVISKE